MATYSFDEQSVKRIGDAVRKVERMGGDRNQPPVEYETQTESFRTVIRGTFSGEWAKNADATVSFTADNGDSGTKTATNYFADVGTSGESSACCIIQAGGEWILIEAERTTPITFRVATFNGAWNKGTSKTVTFQNGGATATAVNLFADVNSDGDSGVSCAVAKDGAAWYLIAAECG